MAEKRKRRLLRPIRQFRSRLGNDPYAWRVFQLRNCTDYFFATRKRPCQQQYRIKRTRALRW